MASASASRSPRRPARAAREEERPRSNWGGARPGAGRPRIHPLPPGWKRGQRFTPHLRRTEVDERFPLLVTMRVLPVARTLRTPKLVAAIRDALAAGQMDGFRVVHYSVQRDQLLLVLEADDGRALAKGMQGLAIGLARGLNGELGRSGRLFSDRYAERVLRTPAEVRDALHHVLGGGGRTLDPFSSAASLDGWKGIAPADGGAPAPGAVRPKTRLLRGGWKKAGLIDPAAATPAPLALER